MEIHPRFLRGTGLKGALVLFLLSGCASLGDKNPQAREERARENLEDAYKALARRDGREALESLIEAVEIYPCLHEARNLLGVLLFSQGKMEDARLQFQWAAHCQNDRPEYHYNLALTYLFLKQPGFAVPALNRALELSPGEIRFLRALFSAQIMLRRWPEAEELARTLSRVTDVAKNPYFMLELSWVKLSRGSFAEALTLCAAAEEKLQKPWLALMTRGTILELSGNYSQALLSYEKAISLYPYDPHLYMIVGDLYHRLGYYGAAQKMLLQAVTLVEGEPRGVIAEHLLWGYETLADLSYQLGFYSTVPLYLSQLPRGSEVRITPDTAAHYSLGIRKQSLRDLEGAIAEFEQALTSSPRFALGWLRLSETYLDKALSLPLKERSSWIEKAYQAARRLQDLAPKLPYGYYLEGKALVARSDLETDPIRRGTLRTALFAFSKAAQTGTPPDLLPGYEGALFMVLGRYEEAARALSEPVPDARIRYLALWNRVYSLLRSGRYNELPPVVAEIRKAFPGDPDLKWFLPYLQAKRILNPSPSPVTRP